MKRTYGRTDGFTLVELIVVIVVMGILAGVGVLAYNGYVKAAHKGVDRQTVGNLINAIRYADAANPSLFGENGGGVLVLTTGETSTDDAALQRAVEDSVGPLGNVRLAYDKWSLSKANLVNLTDMIESALGTYLNAGVTVGYADEADELWDLVGEITDAVAGGSSTEDQKAHMVILTAHIVSESGADGDSMGAAWTKTGSDIQKAAEGNAQRQGEMTLAALYAGFGGVYARNKAFASYLKKNYAGQSDLQSVLGKLDTSHTKDMVVSGALAADWYDSAVEAYLNKEVSGGKSQAYIDGLAFYTFMNALDTQYGGTNITQNGSGATVANLPDDFWNEGRDYITWASAIGGGKTDLTAMKNALNGLNDGDAAVVVMASKISGVLDITVSPAEADPRDRTEEARAQEKAETPLTVTLQDVSVYEGEASSFGSTLINVKKGKTNVKLTDLESLTAFADDPTVAAVEVQYNNKGKADKIRITGMKVGTTTLRVTVVYEGKLYSVSSAVTALAAADDVTITASLTGSLSGQKLYGSISPTVEPDSARKSFTTIVVSKIGSATLNITAGANTTINGETITVKQSSPNLGAVHGEGTVKITAKNCTYDMVTGEIKWDGSSSKGKITIEVVYDKDKCTYEKGSPQDPKKFNYSFSINFY